jgi:hypothetical protein
MHPKHISKINKLVNTLAVSLKTEARRFGNCGGIDLEIYDPDEYALAKILVTAAIRNHEDDYAPLNKAHKEDLENLKYL